MKKIGLILILSALFVFSVSLLIFNYSGMTGFAISDISSNVSNDSLEITREMAVQAINDSYDVLNEMKNNNFSIVYINDKIIEANMVLEQVDYAMILKNQSSNWMERQAAENALRFVNWKNMSYGDVILVTNEIKDRRGRAFEILDSLTLVQISIERYQSKGIDNSEAVALLKSAKDAFYQDRYDDAEVLIKSARSSVDSRSSEASVLTSLKNGTINFFQRYWAYIIIILVVLGLVFYFSFKKIQKKIIRDKIEKMKSEIFVLDDLMKRAQVERFKENKISGLTYNIRMKKYNERLENIKQNLPVLEKRLAKGG